MAAAETKAGMTKAIAILLMLAMLIQIIKPLGLPGLRRRGDFWKLAVFAFAIWSAALLLRDFT
jgi:hypothetical protein